MESENTFLESNKMELIMEMNTKKLVKEISALKEEMRSIQSAIGELKSVVRNAQPVPKPAPQQEQQSAPKQSADMPKGKEGISIEKYFYCGKK